MSRFTLGARLRALFGASAGAPEFYEELEDILLEADIGPSTAGRVVEAAKAQMRGNKDRDRFWQLLRAQLGESLKIEALELTENTVNLLLVLGVNGVGKTTTIAKLAEYFGKQQKKKVMLAAADTFRAAAIDQLELWGKRLGVPVVRQDPGSDPGAVVFDAISSAQANEVDLSRSTRTFSVRSR